MSLQQQVMNGRVDLAPEDVGYDSRRLQVLDEHFQRLIERGKLQGASYLLSRCGCIFASRAMGKLLFDDEEAQLETASVRKVYSITKMFTAVAVMKLLEDGKLYLQQPVSSVLPEFDQPDLKEVRIFHLLTHTSGIYGDPGFFGESYSMPWFEHIPIPDDWGWLKSTLVGPKFILPGSQWVYSSASFSILGEIITRTSGIPCERFIRESILEPLGLQDTGFSVPESKRHLVCVTSEWERKGLDTVEDRKDKAPRAGNGLYSTLEDLWRFGQMMLNKGTLGSAVILGRKSVETMTRNQLVNVTSHGWGSLVKNYRFGLGIGLNHDSFASPGTFNHEGYGHCGLYMDPVEQFIAVFFVPNQTGWVEEAVVHSRAIMWSGLKPISTSGKVVMA